MKKSLALVLLLGAFLPFNSYGTNSEFDPTVDSLRLSLWFEGAKSAKDSEIKDHHKESNKTSAPKLSKDLMLVLERFESKNTN